MSLASFRTTGAAVAATLVLTLVLAGDPAAAAGVFDSVKSKTSDIYTNARNIVMIIGAIGVLGLGVMAFFGKFKWTWAASLLGGLALIAFVSEILTYFGLTV
jgi:type IV secretory pathway VirB2 component (pilin)